MTTETKIEIPDSVIVESIKILVALYQAFAKAGWASYSKWLYNQVVYIDKLSKLDNHNNEDVSEYIENTLNSLRERIFAEDSRVKVGQVISIANHNKYMFSAPIYEYFSDSLDKVEELLNIDLSGIVDDRPEIFKASHPVRKPEEEGKLVAEEENGG